MRILITGGAGFIGAAMCRYLIDKTAHEVINLDSLTYAADLAALGSIATNERYYFEHADIRDPQALDRIFKAHSPDAVMNFAAESHVDRSIDSPGTFIQTNIIGTYNLLQAARKHYAALPESKQNTFRFHHISTDEVYGSADDDKVFTEQSPYEPNSPYSASKASADHLVRAWNKTFGLPTIISNCSNNYGPHQHPEKFIPVLILNTLAGKPLPIYGKGENIRDWLYINDHIRALYLILTEGRPGEKYNIGGNVEKKNVDVARTVCKIMDKLCPDAPITPHESLISFVKDRPGHDQRYAIDYSKIHTELGWEPKISFEDGLEKTVQWYLDNADLWQETEPLPYKKTAAK